MSNFVLGMRWESYGIKEGVDKRGRIKNYAGARAIIAVNGRVEIFALMRESVVNLQIKASIFF